MIIINNKNNNNRILAEIIKFKKNKYGQKQELRL